MIGNEQRPLAVVGRGGTLTASLLRRLTGRSVEELTPCQAVMAAGNTRYRAVVVENFDDFERCTLSACAAARWELSLRADVTVAALDDGEGRRLAACGLPVFSYSDGLPQADLAAENVRVREGRLEFLALAGQELRRVRLAPGDRPRLYDHLAALAGALAVGIPLETAVARLAGSD